jgi:prepilin-type N-terminal cleavage/methylation domain-containing protein
MAIKSKNRSGFTVIELLIATAVFSVVLLVFLTAFLRISELFYKGVNLSNTQEVARKITQSLTNDIQFYQGLVDKPLTGNYFCIGNHRYAYNLFQQYTLGSGRYVLLEENLTGCPSTTDVAPSISAGKELTSPGMQLNKFDVTCRGKACTVNVRVVFYGSDPSVLSPAANSPVAICTGPSQSTQYCATAEYDSTVLQGY